MPMEQVHRIAVVGPPGSGKSTVAVRLGDALGLPVVHLDRLYWSADWTEAPADVFRERHTQAIDADRWVIDGLYSSATDLGSRLRRADLIVATEAPTIVC